MIGTTKVFVGAGFVVLSVTPEAHAYLDPGTGSILLQAIVGSVAAGLVAGRVYWHRLKAFFSGSGSKAETRAEEDPLRKGR